MNVFVRIDFGSTIELVSFDESQVVTFNGEFVCDFRNDDYGTRSRSDNTVDSPHGFIIHGIIISKNIKEVTKIIDVENWQIDNSRVLMWIVLCSNGTLLFRRRSLRFRVRSGSGNGSTSSELEARVCIQGRICLGQFARKLYGDLKRGIVKNYF
ncbi:hypothetical protein Tco_1067336 [Tanacetum coccineum]|uniref:Uncharacterized protein n=1 Tax=Tanacetum coccineum TaxID=301880 RepID=A0ABQ5HDU4_9ASTR